MLCCKSAVRRLGHGKSRVRFFCIVYVDRAYTYVRVKGVLVQQDGAPGEVGDVEIIREALVLQLINRFQKCDDVPLHHNVLSR